MNRDVDSIKLLQSLFDCNSNANGHTDRGEQCGALRVEIQATCRGQVATMHGRRKKYPLQKQRVRSCLREITSEPLQQQQPRKRSCRPWGCYLRPGSPSSQRPSRQKAAFVLLRNGFCISYFNAGSMSPRNGDTNILQRNHNFVKTKRELS